MDAALRDQMHLRIQQTRRLHRIAVPCVVIDGIVDRRIIRCNMIDRLHDRARRHAVAVAFELQRRQRRQLAEIAVIREQNAAQNIMMRRILPLEQDAAMLSCAADRNIIAVVGIAELNGMLFSVDDAAELETVIADMIFNDECELTARECKLHQ